MAGYTKEFLMQAYFSRYEPVLTKMPTEKAVEYRKMCTDFYDTTTKEKFRQYASLNACTIREYKNRLST